MSDFHLSANRIKDNWTRFRNIVNEQFPSRSKELNVMYDSFEEVAVMAPASSVDIFHNAIPGGYIDHVLRVYDFAMDHYNLWTKNGLKVDNFTLEELQFAAIHHDLGKLGYPYPNQEKYLPNDSDWHRKNQGKIYKNNPNVPYLPTSDLSFYLLNHFKVPYTLNEMLGIKLTDGLYDEISKPFFISWDLEKKLRNNIPYILHHADLMAARFEFERYIQSSGKPFFYDERKVIKSETISTNNPKNSTMDLFDEMFGN